MDKITTTVDQHQGEHAATGLRIMAMATITTERAEGMDDEDLQRLHDARVALASLDVVPRRLATEQIEAAASDDPADEARVVEAAVKAAAGSTRISGSDRREVVRQVRELVGDLCTTEIAVAIVDEIGYAHEGGRLVLTCTGEEWTAAVDGCFEAARTVEEAAAIERTLNARAAEEG